MCLDWILYCLLFRCIGDDDDKHAQRISHEYLVLEIDDGYGFVRLWRNIWLLLYGFVID